METGIKLDDIDNIFGRYTSGKIIDKTIMHTKSTIYNNRKTGKKHYISDVKRSLYDHLLIEEHHAVLNQRDECFWTLWEKIYNEL